MQECWQADQLNWAHTQIQGSEWTHPNIFPIMGLISIVHSNNQMSNPQQRTLIQDLLTEKTSSHS